MLGGQSGCVVAAGLAFTPLYLLKSHFGPPVAAVRGKGASILCLTQTYTQTRSLVRALAHLTHAQSVSLRTRGESTEAYHDSAGSGAGDPAQKKMFSPSFLDFFGLFPLVSSTLE